MPGGNGTGPMGQGAGTGKGRGQCQGGKRGPKAQGSGGNCTCPQCGNKTPHSPGQPCNQQVCATCGAIMIRD